MIGWLLCYHEFLLGLESTVKSSAPSTAPPQTLHVMLCQTAWSVFHVQWLQHMCGTEQSPYSVWRDNRTVVWVWRTQFEAKVNIYDAVGWVFTFSALFHSYNNPNNMCGECDSDIAMTCEEAGVDCFLRYLYCLRPYGSSPPVVSRLPQAPLIRNTDGVIFEEGFIVVGGQDNIWNGSNPFTRELQLWPVKFYRLAVYGF